MKKEKIIDIIQNVENSSNKDLFSCLDALNEEYENTKSIIIELTTHMDKLESLYETVNKEIQKRS
jgi:hypothetical protein